jgi:hypothetical protein
MVQWHQKFNKDLAEDSGFLGYDAMLFGKKLTNL